MKRAFIIFSGFNQRAVISFIRTLELHNIPYAIIAKSKDDPIFLTKYRQNVTAIRSNLNLNLKNIIECIKKTQKKLKIFDQYIITPSTESLNRFLLLHKKEFNQNKCKIPLVNLKLYELISDKEKFYKLCRKNKLLVPKTFENFLKAEIPFVAKPKQYYSKKGGVYYPIFIFNKKQKANFIKEYPINDFFYQKFIPGRSFYLLYYFFKDRSIIKLSQENFIQQNDGKSIIAAETSNFHLSRISLNYENLLKSLNFFGLIMIEIRNYKNKNYMIEANPRFWGPSQLFIDSKVNLFDGFLFDLKLLNKKPHFTQYRKTKYFWFGGFIETIRSGKKLIFHNYNLNKFLKTFNQWFNSDIYNRSDTFNYFVAEIKL